MKRTQSFCLHGQRETWVLTSNLTSTVRNMSTYKKFDEYSEKRGYLQEI